MAGLIDVGIIKPELAGSFAAGYRGAEQARQQSAQAEQQLARGRQQMQYDEMKMEQLKQDREMMLQLQQRLKAAGQDPDLDKVFDALIATGNPDYVMKGMEGKQRLRDQREYARITGGGFGAPGAATPTGTTRPLPAPGALGSGTFEIPIAGAAPAVAAPVGELVARPIVASQGTVRDISPTGEMGPERSLSTLAPANALAPAASAAAPINLMAPRAPVAAGPGPAPVNALAAGAPGAAAPAVPNAALITQTQDRINQLLSFAGRTQNPQMATNALAQAKVLQDQLELYSKPARNEPAALQELRAYMAMSPEEKAAFEKLQKIKQPNVSATASASSPTGKSLAGPVGQRAETSLVKAEGASGIMENANLVREALNSGNVIAGPLAGPRLKFAQVLELAGAGDKQKLVNTRNAIQGLAAMTLESRAELKGQGQVTENEQKLLERARSGSIEDMTVVELQQIVNVSQRLANRLWSNHQTLLKTMETDPAAADALRYYRPTTTLPQALGEGKPQTPEKANERKQNLDAIFGAKR